MNASVDQICSSLKSDDSQVLFEGVRGLKNQIIGNTFKKRVYLQARVLERIIQLLGNKGTGCEVLVECAVVVGSFSSGFQEGLEEVIKLKGVVALLEVLKSSDHKLVLASIRALKQIFENEEAVCDEIFGQEDVLQIIVQQLSNKSVQKLAAQLIARICRTCEEADKLESKGVLAGLLTIIKDSNNDLVKEAGLDALATLTRLSPQVCLGLAVGESIEKIEVHSRTGSPNTKLLACKTLTNVYSTSCQVDQDDEYAAYSCSVGLKKLERFLPTIVRLLGYQDLHQQVPEVLVTLIKDRPSLQKLASESDIVQKLSVLFESKTLNSSARESTLDALGLLCEDIPENRRKLQGSQQLIALSECLKDKDPGVRRAAAYCIRSITRSVEDLAKEVLNEKLVEPLFDLLKEDIMDVKLAACCALCNLVLEFSQVRVAAIKAGVMEILVDYARSMEASLQEVSTFALRNLMYMASAELKTNLLEKLTWDDVKTLMRDGEPKTQEHVLGLLRNIAHPYNSVLECDGEEEHQMEEYYDMNFLMQWSNGELLTEILAKIRPDQPNYSGMSSHIIIEGLFTFVNLAVTPEDQCKQMVFTCGILPFLPQWMDSQDEKTRSCCVWLLINLLQRMDNMDGARNRFAEIKRCGIWDIITDKMKNDRCFDVSERIRQLLDLGAQLQEGEASGSENAQALDPFLTLD
eukprot:TRINITY_DN9515_c0_g1_i3.p1 TRINITY_DN9515_c0_g1~~TRINITY_DN9515_c0_g1_i3.p1  ORF type:complete len:691 (-),score=140.77 TRINITY_DN9515_c0_g1_i3:597-2669(-)